jgi:hypothetical protein
MLANLLRRCFPFIRLKALFQWPTACLCPFVENKRDDDTLAEAFHPYLGRRSPEHSSGHEHVCRASGAFQIDSIRYHGKQFLQLFLNSKNRGVAIGERAILQRRVLVVGHRPGIMRKLAKSG